MGAKAPAAQPPSTALPAKPPVTPESLDKFLEETEHEREDHHLVKKTLVFVLGESIIFWAAYTTNWAFRVIRLLLGLDQAFPVEASSKKACRKQCHRAGLA